MIPTRPEHRTDLYLQVAVILGACALYLPFIASFGLWDPWETHYGEVARQMIERGDWISPWWGTHWSRIGETPEGAYFFSKPVFLLWAMGLGMKLFGVGVLGVRIFVAAIAIVGVYLCYLAGSRVWDRRAGVLMAVCLGTSPFYAMLSRQAQTDMPFVGLMTSALCFFMLAAFAQNRRENASRAAWWFWIATVGVFTFFQMHTIVVGQLAWKSHLPFYSAIWYYGPFQAALYLIAAAVIGVSLYRSENRSRQRLSFLWFYTFVAFATMAKGILGFALPGAIIFAYLLVTGNWALLRDAMIARGIGLAVVVGFPWYGAMFARHGGIGGAFWDRFIIHDHFKRLASGVHQTDTGSFEHFIRWLGYGLFPWGSFVPAAFATAFAVKREDQPDGPRHARVFIFLWFLVAFALFTESSTKFHHYIFPAVPALALLAALVIHDRITGRLSERLWTVLMLSVLAMCIAVGFDLAFEPQNLKNLFTYRYDRKWADAIWDPEFQAVLRVLTLASFVSILGLLSKTRWLRNMAIAGLSVSAFAFCTWALSVYMPTIANTWSQQGLWQTYYELCTPTTGPPGTHPSKKICVEPAIAYRLQWRGETFYTYNEVVPLRNEEDWNYFVNVNDGRCFYGIAEHGSIGAIRRKLPDRQGDTVEVLPSDTALRPLFDLDPDLYERYLKVTGLNNIKFGLFRANCDGGTEQP